MSAGFHASGSGRSLSAQRYAPGTGLDFFATSRFEVVRHLGSGGMGSVFEARDCELDAHVALKRLDRCEPQHLIRFKREFREFKNLCHPNLVTLRELFSDGAEWFFSMELLDGGDFLEYVRPSIEEVALDSLPLGADVTVTAQTTPYERQLAPQRRARFVRGRLDENRLRLALPQLALGVQALHDAGKLHCDIKPANVRVTSEGRVVLLDYGAAVDRNRERAPSLIGTLGYMAPEQATCAPITCAADWYAVGVVLYEALTGRRPYEGTHRIFHPRQAHRVASPRDVEPKAPRDLSALCEELLALDPAARPSGSEVLERLGATAPVRRQGPRQAELVGWPAQIAALDAACQRARQQGQLVRIYGEAGVGKSALVRQFLAQVERRNPCAVVLTGSCSTRECVPYNAFDGVIDALGEHLESLTAADAQRVLPEDIALVANAFPVLWSSGAIRAAATADRVYAIGAAEQRERLFSALRHVFRQLSEQAPLVIAIDDLQCADEDSIALLSALLTEPHTPRLLLVATVRADRASYGSLERAPRADVVLDVC